MRLIGIIVLAAIMYFAVPLLWQRAVVAKVNEVSANSAGIPVGNAVEINYAASENLVNSMNVTVVNTEAAQQAQSEEIARQGQAASDRAWAETH